VSDKITKEELMELLDENYYTLTSTGGEAAYAIISDFAEGRFLPNLEEWGIDAVEFIMAYNDLIDQWLADGKMEVPAMEWSKNNRES
jgi:hypothetical protein